jgi:hypothetical protein
MNGCEKNILTANDIELMMIEWANNLDYELFKKKASEKWVRLSYLENALDTRRHDACFPEDYRIALNWVKLVLEE